MTSDSFFHHEVTKTKVFRCNQASCLRVFVMKQRLMSEPRDKVCGTITPMQKRLRTSAFAEASAIVRMGEKR